MVRKRRLIFSAVIVLVVLSFFLSMLIGSVRISFHDLFNAFFSDSSDNVYKIIRGIRLPRVLLSVLVGINVSLSGLILQSVMKNPLADPSIIGVSSGAGFFGILMILMFPEKYNFLPLVTFLGGLLALIIVYSLSFKFEFKPSRVILSGVAVSSLFGAGISFLLLFFSDRVGGALMFMSGSLSASSMSKVLMVLPYTISGLIIIILGAERLNILALGDDMATTLGLDVRLNRFLFLTVSAFLTASSVAAIGLLGFLGLIVPHFSRLLVSNNHKYLVYMTPLLGSLILMLSDTFARSIFSPIELPVGMIMALLGAPFFLYLLRKSKY